MVNLTSQLENIMLWGVGLITLVITPWFSYDPFNVPRLFILVTCASIMFFKVALEFRETFATPAKSILIIISLFTFQMILVIFFAPGNKWQQFFGAGGRQTGFLTYLSLSILLMASLVISTSHFLKKFTKMLVIVGSVSIIYGLIQTMGMDPFPWTNPYSPVFGFFGNPNFQSSFIGFNSAATGSLLFGRKINKNLKIFLLIYLATSLFVILKTRSQQGFLVFGVTILLVVLIYVFKNSQLQKFRYFATASISVGIIAVLLDILQRSPWNSLLYKPSVSYRGDFWRAGIKMTSEHPFFGVGLDSYRDWFLRSRDAIASTRPDPNTYIDSSHNILLDFSSNGGIPLLIIYLAIVATTAVSVFKVIRRTQEFEPYFIAIFALWIGYQIQSLISINQIGLAIWGWVTSGIIIGYEINTRQGSTSDQLKGSKFRQQHKVKKPNTLVVLAGLLIGFGFGAPAFVADADFRASIDSKNIERINTTANKWPKDVIRMNFISRFYAENNLPDKALEIAKDATRYSPETFESWRLIYEISSSTAEEKAGALSKMKELDANYPK